MKYKVIGSNDIYNIKKTVLENRGIDEGLFNLDESVIEDYNNYDNIIEGCELLMKHIENESEICIVIDSDVDGITSSSLLANYLYREFPTVNIVFKYHEGKQHGLSDITIENGVNLVIVPDAGTNDVREIEELYKRGIEVLIIDHHHLEVDYPKYGVLINNQTSSKVINKNLSGVGVVYKFLCCFSEYYFLDSPEEFLDLVSLGNIGDVMSAREKETRYFMKQGLKNINNKFIKALIKEKEFDMEGKLNIMSIGWTISPLINGCIRSGSLLDKAKLYTEMINQSNCEEVAKLCKNAKSRQDSSVKRDMAKIEKNININKDDRVIILSSMGASKSKTGLIAGKLCSKYKLPVLLYSSEGDVLGGSARGLGDINLRDDLNNSGIANGIGHNLAFGWDCKKDNIEKLKAYLNEKYKDVDFGSSEYEVDFELYYDELTQELVDEIANMEDEWGNGIEAPLIVVKDVYTYLDDSNIKGRLNVVWDINGVKCIKKFTSNAWKEEFLNREFEADMIFKCVIDNYNKKGCLELIDLNNK